ncbi:MAG: NAD(P)H:quinone oxidoreductase [Alphaproteobacteria bacterium]|nr:NAD(P)H:quinone oxidoreductase [Alphaproteobacteria bacterium]MBU1514337.1 NAD(P)H:quinone oxidoreductase [Alphaproteobacteria bacterium]MBU2095981.1 NAD(P)H:quinone oxidoreductase [Alphaproteobacteria bacterium]MBU2153079.1 NAD(P)H:quinone oxidoreductase [Alphaproteobacteria bacterium]MBU2308536.1 NAD(P)H:quinone oxidoreductase [Alphaproteobacteria bacterium]
MTCNILVAFYSRSGSVESLAQAIGEGAESAGAKVRLRRARELVGEDVMALAPGWSEAAARMNAAYEAPTATDAEWADGILVGSPTRFGGASSELRAWLEGLGAVWFQNKLVDKAGGAFTSTSTTHGGAETTVLSLYPTLAHLGLVIVPNGYGAPLSRVAGTPYGSSSVSAGPERRAPTEQDLEIARAQGRRLAEVAGALRALREARS